MTRRLLVVLDPDADTPVATRYAVEIARRYDGELTGLALVDTRQILDATAGGGIGAMYFAERLRQELTEETREKARGLLRRFVEQVEAAGARHADDHVAESDGVRAVTDEMKTHDLLVVGREAHFYYADPDRRTDALAKVVESGAAGTLVVGTEHREVRRVLVAYDGGRSAARALQKFVHLAPFGTDLEVELYHVRSGGREAQLESEHGLAGARAYVEAYGFASVVTTSDEGGKPAERIMERAARADLVVAGAYDAHGLKRLFSGSTAKALIDHAPGLLFVYH
jgi:nucleotide-binding universal stress UspA family protein